LTQLTAVDTRYAEWFHWARAKYGASNDRCHEAARAAMAASGADAATAAAAAIAGGYAGDGQPGLDSGTRAYAEWYDWAVSELRIHSDSAHRAAADMVRRLESGWSPENVMTAARAEYPRSTPVAAVLTPAARAVDGARRPTTAPTEATRYLCAAAYLDRSVCNRILSELEATHLAIATSPGVDLVTVMTHGLVARRRHLITDLILGVLLLISLIFGIGTILIGLIVAWCVVIWATVRQDRLLANQLAKGTFDGAAKGATFDPDVQRTLAYASAAQKGNVSVYSGFSPFVGSGLELGGWSFAVNLGRPKIELGQALTPLNFEVSELYHAVTDRIMSIGLDSITVDDRLFVNGSEIREDPRFMPDVLGRPVTAIQPELIAQFVNDDSTTIRHYKRITSASWNSEMVVTIFVRFHRTDQSVFAEAAYQLLTPLKDSYHRIDMLSKRPSPRQYFDVAGESVLRTPLVWIASPFHAVAALAWPIRRWSLERTTRRMIAENPSFDFGARGSIRDQASSHAYHRYFQKLDKEMLVKVIERHLLDCIIEFLDAKNIDTTDLRQQQTTILNSGLIVSGGAMHAENIAVGSGANIAGRITRMVNASRGQAGS
jgi:hypothetical protein